MSCDRARELMIDAHVEPLDQAQIDELRQHIAGCEVCAAEAAGIEQLWGELFAALIPEPRANGLERLQASVREEFGAELDAPPPTRTRPDEDQPGTSPTGQAVDGIDWTGLLWRAAASIALVGLGVALATGYDALRQESTPTLAEGDRYLLIMTATAEGPELADQVATEMGEWIQALAEQGVVESVVGLVDGLPVGTPPSGTLLTGRIAGFMIIRAADPQEARRIAVSSPSIQYGGFVEIRAINGGG